jgi:hypothetical protein
LGGDQVLPQQSAGEFTGFCRRLNHFNPAAFTPSTGVDLGFDHRTATQVGDRPGGFIGSCGYFSVGHGDAVSDEKGFCLVFVDLHFPGTSASQASLDVVDEESEDRRRSKFSPNGPDLPAVNLLKPGG